MHSITWTIIGIFLVILVGCGSPSSPGATPTTPANTHATPTPTANATVPVTAPQASDWTTYHNNNARTGYLPNIPDPHQFTRAWDKTLDGAVYAEPLVIGKQLIIATEGDSIYSLDAQSGQVQWRTQVGTPAPRSALPCGNIDPSGITGTPVYDPATHLIFAVAEITGVAHILVGLDLNTGAVKVRRTVDTPDMDPRTHQERGALTLSQGMIYIPFGGRFGDCGDYHGRVIGVRTDGQGNLLSYKVPTTREGGIWAPPGAVMDDAGHLYVSVGNGEVTQGQWDHTDSVLRLSPTLQLQDGFAPQSWPQDNASDADLGSMSPVLLPNGLIFMVGKSGQAYLLHANALGGVGGQIQQTFVCQAYGGAATADSQVFLPCVDGVRQVKIGPGETMTVGWQAPQSVNGSPIIGGHTIYVVDHNNGVFYALNRDTGAVRTSMPVGITSRFATPTLSNGLVFIGTLQGIVAIKLV
ncbi:MAG TPA: PQQ-binding-like beta-propeller repeat protein [Ktedonobacteraceae bacterium]|nr:PQQ-binding-like beta-propeller repeat protein [Ktedonobacteraceae bacterium]